MSKNDKNYPNITETSTHIILKDVLAYNKNTHDLNIIGTISKNTLGTPSAFKGDARWYNLLVIKRSDELEESFKLIIKNVLRSAKRSETEIKDYLANYFLEYKNCPFSTLSSVKKLSSSESSTYKALKELGEREELGEDSFVVKGVQTSIKEINGIREPVERPPVFQKTKDGDLTLTLSQFNRQYPFGCMGAIAKMSVKLVVPKTAFDLVSSYLARTVLIDTDLIMFKGSEVENLDPITGEICKTLPPVSDDNEYKDNENRADDLSLDDIPF